MLIVDPWHWLTKDGEFPEDHPQLRPRIVRIARFIEYGAEIPPGWARSTLVECKKRPDRRPCQGFMFVMKQPDDSILAICDDCLEEEALIHNWQDTPWGHGMPPARDLAEPD